jgi:hypothetical protein
VRLLDKVDLQQAPDVKLVLEHERIFKLMKGLMSTSPVPPKVSTVDYKWLRAVPTNQFTGLHTGRYLFVLHCFREKTSTYFALFRYRSSLHGLLCPVNADLLDSFGRHTCTSRDSSCSTRLQY